MEEGIQRGETEEITGWPDTSNRTVGQIYALLYVSAKPLNADEVGEALGFSRSNVSMGLKELQSWNLVRLIHQPNDRREYFQAPEDVWAIFRTLANERRKREIDPTLSILRDALMEQPSGADDIHAQARMKQMHSFIELMTDWLDDVQKMDSETLASLMKMGAQVQKLLEMKDRVKQAFTGKPAADPQGLQNEAHPVQSERGAGHGQL
ncbi:COG1510 Predicted transcriptional regulators [Comamonadaceae bacterium]